MGHRQAGILLAMSILLLVPGMARAQVRPGETIISLPQSRPLTGNFPEIRDWRTLHIKLTRTPCFGFCPGYTVEIDGDGTVHYWGGDFVVVTGRDTKRISPTAVRDLVAAFRKAEFYRLFPAYMAAVTDFPGYTVEIAFDGQSRKVLDYGGTGVSMPRDVRDLENLIDKTAVTERWVTGNGETVAILKSKGWNFRMANSDNAKLLESAGGSGSPAFLNALLAEHIPVHNANGCVALDYALTNGDQSMALSLIAAGAPATGDKFSCEAISTAAQNADMQSLKILLSRGAPWIRRKHLPYPALHAAIRGWADSKKKGDYPATLRLLLSAGANPNAVDDRGNTLQAYAIAVKLDEKKRAVLADILAHPK